MKEGGKTITPLSPLSAAFQPVAISPDGSHDPKLSSSKKGLLAGGGSLLLILCDHLWGGEPMKDAVNRFSQVGTCCQIRSQPFL